MDELQFSDENEQIERKNSTGKKIVFAVFVLLLIAGLIYFTLFDKDSENLQKITNSPIVQDTLKEANEKIHSIVGETIPTNLNSEIVQENTASTKSQTFENTKKAQTPTDSTAENTVSGKIEDNINQVSEPVLTNVNQAEKTTETVVPKKPEDSLAVIPASEAARLAIEKNKATPPPPLYTEKKNTLAEEILRTETTPTTSQSKSLDNELPLSSELRQSISNDELGLGDFAEQQDSVVSIGFIDNLAKWLVDSYRPSKSGAGKTSASVQSANLRYGANLTGLKFIESTAAAGRQAILKYVYSPGMIDALYRLYDTRFFDALAYASQEKTPALSPSQIEDMYKVYANYLENIGKCLMALAETPNLNQIISKYHTNNEALILANNNFSKLLHELDIAVGSQNLAQEEKLRASLPRVSQIYEQAIKTRDISKQVIIKDIRAKSQAGKLDDDTIFFLSLWVDRRIKASESAIEATRSAANVCFDLASKLSN